MKKIKINQELNTFEDADTQSSIIGKIKVGTYDIVEIRENYPNTSTDYVKLLIINYKKMYGSAPDISKPNMLL